MNQDFREIFKWKMNCIFWAAYFNTEIMVTRLGRNWWLYSKNWLSCIGLARRIYEDSDAIQQLEGFYDEVSTPLLTNVTFHYIGGSVDVSSLVWSDNKNVAYYEGSEKVVVGKITKQTKANQQLTAVAASVRLASNNSQAKFDARATPLVCNK